MHKFLLFGIFLGLLTQLTFAQAPEIEWQRCIGSDWFDGLGMISPTSDGGYIVGANSPGGISGDKTEPAIGFGDFWVLKLDSAGNIQWQNTIGGDSGDGISSICQTPDGGYIIGGNSTSNISGDKNENAIGPYDYSDYWIVKLNATGAIEWQNTIGGFEEDILQQVWPTSDGGYIVGGYSWSWASGDKTEDNIGGPGASIDFWILKLNASGDIVWQNTIGGDHDDDLSAIVETPDGGFLAGGYSYSGVNGDKTEALVGYGTSDYWIVKLDSSGDIIWQNDIGGSAGDYLNCMENTTDGGFILAGSSYSGISGDKSEASVSGTQDIWIVKLNSLGAIEWDKTIGGNYYDNPKSIKQTPDGGYIIAAESSSGRSADKLEENMGEEGNNYDYWIIKLTPSGSIEWQNTIGSEHWDYVKSVIPLADGSYMIGGSANSGISRDKTVSVNSDDVWLVKLPPAFSCMPPPWSYVSNITSTSVKINWTFLDGVAGVQISYRPTAGGSWQKRKASGNAKALTGLLPATEYTYKIRSGCDYSLTEYSTPAYFTTLPLREVSEQSSEELLVFPNPVADQLYVDLPAINMDSQMEWIMYDMTGRQERSFTFDPASHSIQVADLPSGFYWLKLRVGEKEYTASFVKLR